jgi:hypothetical protein
LRSVPLVAALRLADPDEDIVGRAPNFDEKRITVPEHRPPTLKDLFVVTSPPTTLPSEKVVNEVVHYDDAQQAVGANRGVDYQDDHSSDFHLPPGEGRWSAYGSEAAEVVALPSDAPQPSLLQKGIQFLSRPFAEWFKRRE